MKWRRSRRHGVEVDGMGPLHGSSRVGERSDLDGLSCGRGREALIEVEDLFGEHVGNVGGDGGGYSGEGASHVCRSSSSAGRIVAAHGGQNGE